MQQASNVSYSYICEFFFFFFTPTEVVVEKNEPSAEMRFCSVNQQEKIAAASSEELFLRRVQNDVF